MFQAADHELLELINEPSTSNQAFEEFYKRFKDFVLKVCRQCCRAFDHSDQLADDIFQQTFLKVLNKAYTFQKKGGLDKEQYTGEIKGWLSRIARNELINFLRKNPDEKSLTIHNRVKAEDIEELLPNTASDPEKTIQPSIQKGLLDKGLSLLSEEERMVLMTYMLYYDQRSPNKHLPDEIIKTLTTKLNVKAASLRQIKSRALKKLMKLKDEFELIN